MTPVETTLGQIRDYFNVDVSDRGDKATEIAGVGRNDLALFFERFGFDRGAEIGVMEGEYSQALLEANPDLRLVGVDPYSLRDDYVDRRRTQDVFDGYLRAALARLDPYIRAGRYDLLPKRSEDARASVPDRSLDFVFIDGHHNFQNVTNDIAWWSTKVRIGGIVAGHDYYETRRPGFGLHVKQVVDAWTRAYQIRPWFVLGRKNAVAGEYRDDHRSFVFVNRETGAEIGR